MELIHFASKTQVAALFGLFPAPAGTNVLDATLPHWLEVMYIYAFDDRALQQFREQWRQRRLNFHKEQL